MPAFSASFTRGEALSLWEQVKANNAALNACKRHRFEARPVKLGEKQTCLECGGKIQLTDLGQYIAGYVAAGGNVDDIWPGYNGKMVVA
jgi:hypothetical protein